MQKSMQFTVNLSYEKTYRTLSDLEKYAKIHPLIRRVHKTREPNRERLTTYQITERPFSNIPINIHYSVNVLVSDNMIEYKIRGIPFTQARIKYILNKMSENNTEIDLNLDILSRLPGKRILFNKMIKAQMAVIDAIQSIQSS